MKKILNRLLLHFSLALAIAACGRTKPQAIEVPVIAHIASVEVSKTRTRVTNSDGKVVLDMDHGLDEYHYSRKLFIGRFGGKDKPQVIAINANGLVIFSPSTQFPNPRIAVSKNIALIEYDDRGHRIAASNATGGGLSPLWRVYPESKIYLTDDILAVRYNFNGTRIVAYHYKNGTLVGAGHRFENAQVFVSNAIVAIKFDENGTRVLSISADKKCLMNIKQTFPNAEVHVSNSAFALVYGERDKHIIAKDRRGKDLLDSSSIYSHPSLSLSDKVLMVRHQHGIVKVPLQGQETPGIE